MDDFNVCRKYDDLSICPPMGPIYNRNTDYCELALFLERTSAKHKLKFPPIFIEKCPRMDLFNQ